MSGFDQTCHTLYYFFFAKSSSVDYRLERRRPRTTRSCSSSSSAASVLPTSARGRPASSSRGARGHAGTQALRRIWVLLTSDAPADQTFAWNRCSSSPAWCPPPTQELRLESLLHLEVAGVGGEEASQLWIGRRRSDLDGGGRIFGGGGRILDDGGDRSLGSRRVRWLHHRGEREERERGVKMAYRWARWMSTRPCGVSGRPKCELYLG
jgi:hypothetical protein